MNYPANQFLDGETLPMERKFIRIFIHFVAESNTFELNQFES